MVRDRLRRLQDRLGQRVDQRLSSEGAAGAVEGLLLSAVAFGVIRTRTLFRIPTAETVRLGAGYEMHLDLADTLQLYLFLFGVWEPSTSALVERLAEPDRVFVDIGAHAGYYSLLAASRGCHVIAFEPNPDMARCLSTNVELNDIVDMVTVRQVAVAADDRGRTLYLGPRHNRGLTSTNAKWNLSQAGTVPSAAFDHALDPDEVRRIRILKIDVEGSEGDVLAGMSKTWSLLPDDAVILLELSPRWWKDDSSVDELLAPPRAAGFKEWAIENSYSPVRYLFRNRVSSPAPVTAAFSSTRRRYDLVLARHPGCLGSG